MAGKKGQPVQLQTEINNDEDWDKLLQKDGLIVVDIYSDWCGPCLGMQANLKKLKLEIGGDMLQLAVAKSDTIGQLERFRNKSEPTWMFLSKGKMVNLMFGADAPKLTRIIIDELKKEQAIQNGQTTDRTPMEVTDLADEEKVRFDAKEAVQREIRGKEEKKKAKELLERRTKECDNIVKNLPNFGTAIVFPSAKDRYKEVLQDLLDEAGLIIQQTDKIRFTEELMTELCFFSEKDTEFTEEEQRQLYENDALLLLFKVNPRAEVEDIDHAILRMIYGDHKKPPGSHDCMAKKLLNLINAGERHSVSTKSAKSEAPPEQNEPKPEPADEKSEQEQHHVWTKAVWAPHTPFLRATALRLFFPKYSSDFTIAPPEPTPDHIAVVFSFTRKDDVMQIVQEYPKEIMAYGFFTSADADDAKLIAKTVRKLEKATETIRTFEEKLVLKISKKKSEVVFAFAQLGPLRMSSNATEGKIECEKFFPEGYVEEEEEEEPEPEPEPVKKSKKKKQEEIKKVAEEPGEGEEAEPKEEVEEPPEETEGGEPVEGGEEGEQTEGEAIAEGLEVEQSSTAIEGDVATEVPSDVVDVSPESPAVEN